MATFKDLFDHGKVSPISEHNTLCPETESIQMVKTLESVCIVIKAGRPPVFTVMIISLSGNHMDDLRLVEVCHLGEEPVDEVHHVPMNGVVLPASVMPEVKVQTVAGGAGEFGETAALSRKLGRAGNKEIGMFLPLRLLCHNDRRILVAALAAAFTNGGANWTEIRQRRPGPNKTAQLYQFSITQCLLPAMAGDHDGGDLISNERRKEGGQVEGETTIQTAGRQWRMRIQFCHAKFTGLLAKNSAKRDGSYKVDRKNKEIRPNKGARLWRT